MDVKIETGSSKNTNVSKYSQKYPIYYCSCETKNFENRSSPKLVHLEKNYLNKLYFPSFIALMPIKKNYLLIIGHSLLKTVGCFVEMILSIIILF